MENSKDEQQEVIYQNRKLLIAFYHRDNESSNDFFIMIRNCFSQLWEEDSFYEL